MDEVDNDFVYTIRSVSAAPKVRAPGAKASTARAIDADRFGNVLFRDEAVGIASSRIEDGLEKCFAVAKMALEKASGLAASYEVDSITLRLALDAGVGVVFVGDASIEAAIEVEIKKKANTDANTPPSAV